ncbi:hypothetical protein BDW59DRAFT_139109 [Aspergillus cavernicola]|uniref:Uncharacterized protein n=1 Tax=Aspergillus cavernicola TaxID=176166 RepID=A0ABR4IZ91_9EURO
MDQCSAHCLLRRIREPGPGGYGWVDMTHCLGVTTIFGNGFDDLTLPEDPDTVCDRWKSLPVGMDYLAASGLGIGEMTNNIPDNPICTPCSTLYLRLGDQALSRTVQFRLILQR